MIKKNFLPASVCLVILVALTTNPRRTAIYVKNALTVCYEKVIPSLFPFLVLSGYLSGTEMADLIAFPLRIYGRLLKINDKKFATFLLVSGIGGFAVGASFLKNMKDSGYPEKAVLAISPAFINNSFSFCLFTVGTGILMNVKLGFMIYISHCVASLITTFLLTFILKYNIVNPVSKTSYSKIGFAESVSEGVGKIMSICGFVTIFYVICQVISPYIRHNVIKTLLFAVSEATLGCLEIRQNSANNPYLLCVALSILPISTICQVFYFTGDKDIIRTLIFSRLVHTPLSLCIFSVVTNVFPVAAATAALPSSLSVRAFQRSAELSSAMFVCTVLFLLIFDSNKLFTNRKD